MTAAIEKELAEVKASWQKTQEELDKTKSELHDIREELERSQSQLDEVLGELEQTHFELHQLKEKGEQKQSESDAEVKQELEETKSKLQETEELLEKSQSQLGETMGVLEQYQSQMEQTMALLEESQGKLQHKQEELEQVKAELAQKPLGSESEVQKELEETKSQLRQTEELLEQYQSQMEQTMALLEESQGKLQHKQEELEQVKAELAQKPLGSESEVQKELEETKSQLRQTEELLEQYQSQMEQTMATLEESLSQLDCNQKELEQTKFELHQVQQTAKTQPSGFQLTSEKLAQTKSQINQMVTGLNQLLEPLQLKLELSPDKAQTLVDIKHYPAHPPKRSQPLSPLKSQDLKTKTRRESIVVAGVTMFKDEQDVAYHNLVWHYNQGIQRFVVLDNMSSDNTPNEVKRFADDYPDTQVYLIEDPEVGYYQSRKMTAAAEFAHKMWGAEWILPFDADEILCSFRGPLYTVLESIPKEHICIKIPYKVHLLRSFYDDLEPNPFKRITHRQKGDVDKGAKVIIRWRSGMVIGQGNHNVTVDENFLPITNNKNLGLILRHYPFRSKEHIRQKVINGGKAYGSAKDLPKNLGGAWKQWDNEYKIKGEKYIEEMYDSQVKGYPDAIYDPAII